jgi:hypothetical protein
MASCAAAAAAAAVAMRKLFELVKANQHTN